MKQWRTLNRIYNGVQVTTKLSQCVTQQKRKEYCGSEFCILKCAGCMLDGSFLLTPLWMATQTTSLSSVHRISTQCLPSGTTDSAQLEHDASRNSSPLIATKSVTPSQLPAYSSTLAQTPTSSDIPGHSSIISHLYFRRLYCQVRLADIGHPAVRSLCPLAEISLEC
jgi:hypothetical protein